MSKNLTKMVDAARNEKASVFKSAFEDEVLQRISLAMENKKAELASSLFGEEVVISEAMGNKAAADKFMQKMTDPPMSVRSFKTVAKVKVPSDLSKVLGNELEVKSDGKMTMFYTPDHIDGMPEEDSTTVEGGARSSSDAKKMADDYFNFERAYS